MLSSAFVWAKVLAYMDNRLGPQVVASWFDNTDLVELNEERLVLHAPSPFCKEMILRRCKEYIDDALKEIFDTKLELVVLTDEEMESYEKKNEDKSVPAFNPQYTFSTFVVGSSNRFAYSAAVGVAKEPGKSYNPLFIYGPPGVGKTHLLYAIANEIKRQHPDYRIVYIKGDEFTNEMVKAIQDNKNFEFREKYRLADLLLIDDIQFIAGKEGTQEEFFHTFNKLYEADKQIVMTSDRRPSDMKTLQDRLKSRFESGLLADIQPPDYETRMAILRNKANSMGLELPDDVCRYIANSITNNVRQIEGTVKRIQAFRDLNKMPLDLENVSKTISEMFRVEGSALPTPALIISQVSKFYSIDEVVLRGTLRNQATAEARQVAMYLMRNLTNMSTTDIGREFGRDHTTVLHAIRKVESALKDENSRMSDVVRDITANINSLL